jgi:hypothetical protein
MADFHSVTVFGVDRITISKGERDDHKWVTINLGGGSTFTIFKDSQSSDWPEVIVERSEGEYEVMLSREPATEVQDVYGNITTHPHE